ncbi:AAA family ATPase [Sulfolobus tengchongensis]|uniref:AAA family ATPase n=1 Tax=Sulfolobus tengchongensis TaxID=207809 RepID=A0AAX4KZ55_9CREN
MKLRIGIIGLKGGIGKTTIALHTAFYLSKKYKVLYIDKDFLSMGSLILGFNGKGFHKAIADDLGKEEYEYKVNDNLTIFKIYGEPNTEKTFYDIAKFKGEEKIRSAYLDVVRRNYDVIIVDYGVVFSLKDPIVYDEYELFVNNFSEYVISGIGVTSAEMENITSAISYFTRLRTEIAFKPLAFVINMVPQEPEAQKKLGEIASKLRGEIDCEVLLIPFKEEYLQYKNLGNYEDFIRIGRIVESYLNK